MSTPPFHPRCYCYRAAEASMAREVGLPVRCAPGMQCTCAPPQEDPFSSEMQAAWDALLEPLLTPQMSGAGAGASPEKGAMVSVAAGAAGGAGAEAATPVMAKRPRPPPPSAPPFTPQSPPARPRGGCACQCVAMHAAAAAALAAAMAAAAKQRKCCGGNCRCPPGGCQCPQTAVPTAYGYACCAGLQAGEAVAADVAAGLSLADRAATTCCGTDVAASSAPSASFSPAQPAAVPPSLPVLLPPASLAALLAPVPPHPPPFASAPPLSRPLRTAETIAPRSSSYCGGDPIAESESRLLDPNKEASSASLEEVGVESLSSHQAVRGEGRAITGSEDALTMQQAALVEGERALGTARRRKDCRRGSGRSSRRAASFPHSLSAGSASVDVGASAASSASNMPTGERDRTFACSQCPSTFFFKQNRDRHINEVHLGRRPRKCPHEGCEAAFKNRSGLKQHTLTVHEKARSFKCELCEAGFGQRNHLTQHVLVVHEKVKSYECEKCGMTFSNVGNRTQHMRRKHGAREGKRPGNGSKTSEKTAFTQPLRESQGDMKPNL